MPLPCFDPEMDVRRRRRRRRWRLYNVYVVPTPANGVLKAVIEGPNKNKGNATYIFDIVCSWSNRGGRDFSSRGPLTFYNFLFLSRHQYDFFAYCGIFDTTLHLSWTTLCLIDELQILTSS